jgi:hypothetical protein
MAAPGQRAGVPLHDHDARHHVLAGRPADPTLDEDLGPVDQPAAEVAEAAGERDPAARQDADAERMLRSRILDRDVLDALFVDEAAELEVDQPRGEVVRVEGRPLAVDARDLGRFGVRLGEAARVVGDPPLSYRCHTITSPS